MQSPIQMTLLDVHDQMSTDERGAVFTQPEVVEFILDLAGYDPARKLSGKRLWEPSCGHGEFVIAAIDQLMLSHQRHGGDHSTAVEDLHEANGNGTTPATRMTTTSENSAEAGNEAAETRPHPATTRAPLDSV